MEPAIIYKLVFIKSFFLLLYAYGGYTLLLRSLAGLFRKEHVRTKTFQPKVSIIVPVYNEEKVLVKKIENCLGLDYPRENLQIMICSDCSTDRTAAIVAPYIARGITFIDYRERSGKTGVLNKSIPQAGGEILILTDANTMFRSDAVSKLVSLYTNDTVGAVLGQVRLVIPQGGQGIAKELLYRNFEAELKYIEGLFGATIGAFGGFYSIRKSLFVPLPPNAYSNDDLITPMRILQKGYAVLFDREAVSVENTGQNIEEEFKRRVRIGAGNFQSFFLLLSVLNPLRFKIFFLYMSHKVLRWFSPLLLIALFCSTILLYHEPVYRYFLFIQFGCYMLAFTGMALSKMRVTVPVISSMYHFVSMNVALLLGFFHYLRGIKSAVWESTERT